MKISKKTVRMVIVMIAALSASGCGWFDKKVAAVTGGATKTCVDGVQYLQFTSGASVAYTPDGKIKVCSN